MQETFGDEVAEKFGEDGNFFGAVMTGVFTDEEEKKDEKEKSETEKLKDEVAELKEKKAELEKSLNLPDAKKEETASVNRNAGPMQELTNYPILGDDSIMAEKEHGTCSKKVQPDLKFGVDFSTADRLCCFNRTLSEKSGYAFEDDKTWVDDLKLEAQMGSTATYYDSVTGKPLFIAPKGRTVEQFLEESKQHGWPSFRD